MAKMSRMGKSIRTERRLLTASGWRWEETAKYGVSFRWNENALKLGRADGTTL